MNVTDAFQEEANRLRQELATFRPEEATPQQAFHHEVRNVLYTTVHQLAAHLARTEPPTETVQDAPPADELHFSLHGTVQVPGVGPSPAMVRVVVKSYTDDTHPTHLELDVAHVDGAKFRLTLPLIHAEAAELARAITPRPS